MSHHDDTVSVRQMRDHAQEAIDLVESKMREDLDHDRVLELALVRLLEIIGEAANRVSESFKQSFTQLPWADIVGMRNRLIHAYDSVDLDILWDTLRQDLPALTEALNNILESPQSENLD